MTSIAIYARISDDAAKIRAGIGGRNVGEQVADALSYAARAYGVDPALAVDCGAPGWEDAPVVVYRENDVSAYKRQPVDALDPVTGKRFTTYRVLRPAWSSMMSDCRDGRYTAVVGLDLDRYLRDPADLEDAINTAERQHVAWHATTAGDMHLDQSNGQFMARVSATMTRKSSDDTARRVKRAHERRLEAGMPAWTARPFGHRKVYAETGGKRVPIGVEVFEDEARHVRDAAERLLRGTSLGEVVRDWNADGVTTTGGRPWSATSLGQMLRQPRVAGHLEHRGEVVTRAAFPGILTDSTWRALVAELDGSNGGSKGRQRGHTGGAGRLSSLLGGGLGQCGECGGPLTVWWRGGRESGRRYYKCRLKSCTYVSADMVDLEVVGRATIAAGLYEVHLLPADVGPDVSTEVERERTIVADLDDFREALRTRTLDGQPISRAFILPLVAELEHELAAVRKTIAEAEQITTRTPEDLQRVFAEFGDRDLGERRSILGRTYQSIRVFRRYDWQSRDEQRLVTRFADGWLPEDAEPAGRDVVDVLVMQPVEVVDAEHYERIGDRQEWDGTIWKYYQGTV